MCVCIKHIQVIHQYIGKKKRREEEEEERRRVNWCFTPSQPVRLYQGDRRIIIRRRICNIFYVQFEVKVLGVSKSVSNLFYARSTITVTSG